MKLIDKLLGRFGYINTQKANANTRAALDAVLQNEGWERPGVGAVSFMRQCRKYGFKVVFYLEDADKAAEYAHRFANTLKESTLPSFDVDQFARNLIENSKHVPNIELGH